MVEQSGLADACLAAQHKNSALASSHTHRKLIKRTTLTAPAKHPHTAVSAACDERTPLKERTFLALATPGLRWTGDMHTTRNVKALASVIS
ncbi:hypothetical protein AB0I02_46210 [Streptomyces phaeochromogenes]